MNSKRITTTEATAESASLYHSFRLGHQNPSQHFSQWFFRLRHVIYLMRKVNEGRLHINRLEGQKYRLGLKAPVDRRVALKGQYSTL
jgi:hypothetical protein